MTIKRGNFLATYIKLPGLRVATYCLKVLFDYVCVRDKRYDSSIWARLS